MTATKHELFDYSIYECVLAAAQKQIEAMVGVELPFLAAFPIDLTEQIDESEAERLIRVSFEEEYFDRTVEGAFEIGENILKGVAKGRDDDLVTFVGALSTAFRPGYVEAVLQHELHIFESEWFDDQRLINKWEVSAVFLGFGTAPWTTAGVKVKGLGSDLFRVEIIFQNQNVKQDTGNSIDYDMLILPVALTWDEFASTTKTKENLVDWLTRIHRDFLVRKVDLKGHYSVETEELIDHLDALEVGNEDGPAEDPFTTGELVLDDGGRVHFASDLE